MAQTSVAVIGAGVFGGFTALNLLKRGARVTLIDAWGPGHSRASSGGESRVIRATYGPREIYTAWVVRSLELWKQYETQWGRKLYHRTGGLWLVGDDDDFEKQALPLLRKHGVRFEELTTDDAARRFPQMNLDGVQWAIYERDVWTSRPAEGSELSSAVRLIETPGHTPQDITTLVTTADGVAALTHLWWRSDSESDPLAADVEALHANRARVLDLATLIVPGHGDPFPVTTETPE